MKGCKIFKKINFVGPNLTPPFCKRSEPILDEFGDVVGFKDTLDYACFRANSTANFREITETDCIDTLDNVTLYQCVSPEGQAIFRHDDELYYGFYPECVGIFTNEGTWVSEDLSLVQKGYVGQVPDYLPQLGAKCQKTIPPQQYIYTTADENVSYVRYSRLICESTPT